jgi:DMSO/TMAO reductase YedYZ molybdopterin-dependent catalytic subunit
MSAELNRFLDEHRRLARRYFLACGAAGTAALACWSTASGEEPIPPELEQAIAQLEPYFTPADQFRDVSRGKPIPHKLPDEKKREVGLTPETWKLEVLSDPDNPARVGKPMTKADGTELDYAGLMQLAATHAVRFAKVMTCLNIGCPLGMGIWEGVPLREIVWRAQPRENLRRVFYYGYHNDDPAQMFRSSLPIGRVLEDPFDLPPVILCYKLNGQLLDSERGGPVRIVVPEAYGFKSIKWLTHLVLSNGAHSNDTYADGNNDVDSPLKSFAATLSVPREVRAGQPIPVTGYAQVGISGVSKVQVVLQPESTPPAGDDPYFTRAAWSDARVLGPPARWGAVPDDRIPAGTLGFVAGDGGLQPQRWPMRLAKVHWAALLPGQAAGSYVLRCRTIDDKGIAQPMPRPFRKSGHAAIESLPITVVS